ncbi:MAG: 2-keto-4-pentenoate hydratase [Candidatus Nanopelagicales bacterium]|jgi:2-oxo-3-hexenedioate decarboxylase
MSIQAQEGATRLIDAARNRTATTALTGDYGDFDAATAYDLQALVVADRIAQGHQVVGAKLGLTSEAKQKQMNVSEPLYGWLTDDMRIEPGEALVVDRFIQPRVEAEIAFLIGDDLEGSDIGAADVLAATAAVMPAIDVLDSRYAGYSFTLPDVIADNSSSAGYITGSSIVDPAGIDLRLLGVVLEVNGIVVATAAGAAVLGHPASSVAWLVRALARRGEGLSAGMTVLSGACTAAFAVNPGDTVVARIDRLGTVEVPCR